MKLYHYLRQMNLMTDQAKQKVQVFVCGSYSGEAKVAVLLKQLYLETRDISELCTLQFKPLEDFQLDCPEDFTTKIQEILQGCADSFKQTIFFFDELFPHFTIDELKNLGDIQGVDFVLSIRHAYHNGRWTDEILDRKTSMDNEGVHEDEHTIFCQLTKSHRCSSELIDFMYYWLIHSPKQDRLFEEKSFIHSPGTFSGPKPLWLEVPIVEVFIEHATNDDCLKNAKDVLVLYDFDYDLLSIHPLGKHCKSNDWRFCPVNEVMGSEAEIVIIYDLKKVHFEALSRAVHQLIIVTTPKTEG